MPSNIISKTNLDFEMFLKAEFFLHLPNPINPNQPDYFKNRAKTELSKRGIPKAGYRYKLVLKIINFYGKMYSEKIETFLNN